MTEARVDTTERTAPIYTTDPSTLEATWAPPRGPLGFLRADDHKVIGLRFVYTAFAFFLVAGVLALLMRLQLATPLSTFLDPETYNQIFTMHGTTMMFFFVVPMLEGIGIYLVPLMIGARETAFPRLNAYSYWVYLFAGLTLYFGFLVGQAPNVGWFSYVPLAESLYSPNAGVDYWALCVSLIEVSALTQAITLLVTILKCRAPGMTLSRMPIFVWSFLVMSVLVIIAMPTLLTTSLMLELDRSVDTVFFQPSAGGDPLLWQHLFWWFGHPDVYIIFLPSYGIVAAIVTTFARREVVGYVFVILAIVSIGFINTAVWAHHMFAVGLPWLALGFVAAATVVVAVPSGVQIFAWLATVWSSRGLWLATPFLFTVGFVFNFVLGGITGVTVAAVPFDLQVHDTFYVVAHFHYVLIGGMVFPMLAAFYYWFPKVTGRMMSERLGVWNFWVAFIGFNVTFFPMHLAGFWGMPRRVFTFHPGLGLEIPNLISTIGAFGFAASFVLLIVNAATSARRGRIAGDDPWGANTLEWATTSPPQDYNFRLTPSVRSRNPLWMQPEFGRAATGHGDGDHDEDRVLVELRDDRREMLITSAMVAEPQSRSSMDPPSLWPFLTALATAIGFVGAIANLWAVPLGVFLVTVALAAWHWPMPDGRAVPVVPRFRADEDVVRAGRADAESEPPSEEPPSEEPREADRFRKIRRVALGDLTDTAMGRNDVTYWGMILFIVIEAIMFAALVMSYFYLRFFEAQWPPGETEPPDLLVPVLYTVALLLSSAVMWWGERGIETGRSRRLALGVTGAVVLAATYLVLKGVEYGFMTDYAWHDHAYGSISWVLSGFHAAHVLSIVIKGSLVGYLAWKGHWTPERRLGLNVSGLYWHFVVWIWVPLFLVLYIAPRFL